MPGTNTTPGVTVAQEARTQTASTVDASLRPVVAGVCRQIVPRTDTEGAPNADALASVAYAQASLTLLQSEFPDPRDNIAELNIEEGTVGAAISFGGRLLALERGSGGTQGSAFLKGMNLARRAGLRTTLGDSFSFDSGVGNVFTFALDKVNPLDDSDDISVTLAGTMTPAEVAAAINAAAGSDVASTETVEIDSDDVVVVRILSNTWGAGSSITVRSGTSALTKLFGSDFADGSEYRVEGCGFRGQDDGDGDLTTPWIEFYRGDYLVNGATTDFPGAPDPDHFCPILVDEDDAVYTARASALRFTGSNPTLPIQGATASRPGDVVVVDGVPVGGVSAEVLRVEAARFSVGVLNATATTFGADGLPSVRVYDRVEVATMNHASPLAPRHVWVQARGLVFGSVSPAGVAATLTGTEQASGEDYAYLLGSTITFPCAPASLTLDYSVTRGGVEEDAQTFTFAGGPYANIAALRAALASLEDDGIVAGNSGNRLLLRSSAVGASESISILSTGTANTALGFSTDAASTATGRDASLFTGASVTGHRIQLPLTGEYTFAMVISDGSGVHELSEDLDLGGLDTMEDLAQAISQAFGGTGSNLVIYDGAGGEDGGGIPVADIAFSGDAEDTNGELTITTRDGGTDVTISMVASSAGDGFSVLGFADEGGGAQIVESGSAMPSLLPLRGRWTPDGSASFRISVPGVGTPLVNSVITPPAGSAVTMSGLATLIQTRINAVLVAAGNASGLCTVTYSLADDAFTIAITGGGTITVSAPSSGTDLSLIFGGAYTAAQATPWVGATPDVDFETLSYTLTVGADSGTLTHTFELEEIQAGITATTMAQILNADVDANGLDIFEQRKVMWAADGNVLSLRTLDGGVLTDEAGVELVVTSNYAFSVLGVGAASVSYAGEDGASNGEGTGADLLRGSRLLFSLDGSPYQYDVTFSANSIVSAAEEVNDLVAGSGLVAAVGADGELSLTSLLLGAGSRVEVPACTAGEVLGLSGSASGSGRPNPDFYLDAFGVAHIGPSILRSPTTGEPYALDAINAPLYISYNAIRLDVTPSGSSPSLLGFSSLAEAEAAIGPMTTENPLGLGVMLALGAAPGRTVYALGVDEANAAAPYGTYDGWLRTLEGLAGYEVYGMAILTDDPIVHTAVHAHVTEMSAAAGRMERVAFIATPNPVRGVPTTALSGVNGSTNGTTNSFTLESNPGSALAGLGVNPSAVIPVSDDVYLEMLVASEGVTTLYRYNVSRVVGQVLTLRTAFTSTQNTDGFYTTTPLSGSLGLSGQDWSLKQRQDLLVITGTTRPDKGAIAAAAVDEAAAYRSKRVQYIFSNGVDVSIDGVVTRVSPIYAGASLAGMLAVAPPSASLTGRALPGLGTVYGTNDGSFDIGQLSTIKDGGRFVLTRQGNATVVLQSVTTSTGVIADVELSCVAALDRLAKRIRQQLRSMLGGGAVVTPGHLSMISTVMQSVLSAEQELGTILSYSTPTVVQDTTDPRNILIDVTVAVVYPANRIAVTIRY